MIELLNVRNVVLLIIFLSAIYVVKPKWFSKVIGVLVIIGSVFFLNSDKSDGDIDKDKEELDRLREKRENQTKENMKNIKYLKRTRKDNNKILSKTSESEDMEEIDDDIREAEELMEIQERNTINVDKKISQTEKDIVDMRERNDTVIEKAGDTDDIKVTPEEADDILDDILDGDNNDISVEG